MKINSDFPEVLNARLEMGLVSFVLSYVLVFNQLKSYIACAKTSLCLVWCTVGFDIASLELCELCGMRTD